MKKLKEAIQLYEAKLIKGILENEGIEVRLQPSDIAYTDTIYFGEGSITDVLVPDEMLEKAKNILKEYRGKEQ
ncbi:MULTISPECIES: putative signal transducing protein [Kosmotoga]|uniref:DUF2007 domain-containing protein n=1 Tax=Kosmotoga olearia (strain ATCC BAA-1733 / DSM 21960 / TBF 19.5.1) TaxID=521045 RepID=C5CF48_KOSOT|nr:MULTISPECIES: DUF2007 domain-containing protein [Kosmotoga]ACR80313.1 hypothetical protein Kole_1623 [Kosmotoga olearia TBF 19.5.1]MDI3523560.1 hypothetical protein [Kosmotoga sp.]MDK2953040.1 hypothetical protein [Kosmotoga sp.]OAA20245.1 hypothetical protein DU53_08915 [Kosmotoga sp. DU53]